MKPVRNAEILRLAGPLIVTNAIQALLNLTDTWFLGRLSTDAMAAMAAIYWVVTCVIMLVAGVSLAAQAFVAQAFGAGRLRRASRAAWSGIWAGFLIVPVCVALAYGGETLIAQFALPANTTALATQYWWPRVLGLPLGIVVWSLMSFFNGISQTRITMIVAVVALLANVPLNQWFIFDLGYGMAGAAWATNIAQLLSLLLGLGIFLSRHYRDRFASHLTYRLDLATQRRMLSVGLPTGFMYAADLIGVALSQIMIAQASVPGAAATQVVVMLTSAAYQPTLGIAAAGATLVGQAIGARDIDYARRLGNRVILLCVGCMVSIAALLLLTRAAVIPWFFGSGDSATQAAMAIAFLLLWPAAAYQAFDGLYFGAGFALRAAGDTRVPALLAVLLSFGIYVPLAHCLVFTPEQAWVDGLPQFGLAALGGWLALMCYAILLGGSMYWRWRSGIWQRMRLL
jgi:MATE family multidrug resistance protein